MRRRRSRGPQFRDHYTVTNNHPPGPVQRIVEPCTREHFEPEKAALCLVVGGLIGLFLGIEVGESSAKRELKAKRQPFWRRGMPEARVRILEEDE